MHMHAQPRRRRSSAGAAVDPRPKLDKSNPASVYVIDHGSNGSSNSSAAGGAEVDPLKRPQPRLHRSASIAPPILPADHPLAQPLVRPGPVGLRGFFSQLVSTARTLVSDFFTSLRTKISTFITVLVVLVIGSIVSVLLGVFPPEFAGLELASARTGALATLASLRSDLAALEGAAALLARRWDGTEGGAGALRADLADAGAQSLFVLSGSDVVWQTDAGAPAALPPALAAAAAALAPGARWSGLVAGAGGPAMAAAGPAAGGAVLLLLRALDGAALQALADRAQSCVAFAGPAAGPAPAAAAFSGRAVPEAQDQATVSAAPTAFLVPPGADAAGRACPAAAPGSGERAAVYLSLQAAGGPLAVRVDEPRSLDGLRTTSVRVALGVLVFVAAAFVVATFAFLEAVVLRPVGRLTDQIKQLAREDDVRRRLVVPAWSERDEIGRLAAALNLLLGAIRRTRDAVDEAQAETRLARFELVPEPLRGRLLAGEALVAAPPALASALVLKISGWEGALSTMEPASFCGAWNSLMDALDRLCVARGVEPFAAVGDTLLALVGLPRAHGGHEGEAVRLAHEAVDLVARFAAFHLFPVAARAGLASGPVLSGVLARPLIGRCAYHSWGPPLAEASRLCSIARAGRVVVSRATLAEAERLALARPRPHSMRPGATPACLRRLRVQRSGEIRMPAAGRAPPYALAWAQLRRRGAKARAALDAVLSGHPAEAALAAEVDGAAEPQPPAEGGEGSGRRGGSRKGGLRGGLEDLVSSIVNNPPDFARSLSARSLRSLQRPSSDEESETEAEAGGNSSDEGLAAGALAAAEGATGGRRPGRPTSRMLLDASAVQLPPVVPAGGDADADALLGRRPSFSLAPPIPEEHARGGLLTPLLGLVRRRRPSSHLSLGTPTRSPRVGGLPPTPARSPRVGSLPPLQGAPAVAPNAPPSPGRPGPPAGNAPPPPSAPASPMDPPQPPAPPPTRRPRLEPPGAPASLQPRAYSFSPERAPSPTAPAPSAEKRRERAAHRTPRMPEVALQLAPPGPSEDEEGPARPRARATPPAAEEAAAEPPADGGPRRSYGPRTQRVPRSPPTAAAVAAAAGEALPELALIPGVPRRSVGPTSGASPSTHRAPRSPPFSAVADAAAAAAAALPELVLVPGVPRRSVGPSSGASPSTQRVPRSPSTSVVVAVAAAAGMSEPVQVPGAARRSVGSGQSAVVAAAAAAAAAAAVAPGLSELVLVPGAPRRSVGSGQSAGSSPAGYGPRTHRVPRSPPTSSAVAGEGPGLPELALVPGGPRRSYGPGQSQSQGQSPGASPSAVNRSGWRRTEPLQGVLLLPQTVTLSEGIL